MLITYRYHHEPKTYTHYKEPKINLSPLHEKYNIKEKIELVRKFIAWERDL